MMRRTNEYWAGTLLAALALTAGACMSGDINDGDSADVMLQLSDRIILPAVTGADNGSGGCTYVVTEATATLKNVPKSDIVGSTPLQAIQLESVNITYQGIAFSPRSIPLGVVIDPGVTKTVGFFPFDPAELNLVPLTGANVSVFVQFVGRTVGGDTVVATGGASGLFNTCLPDDGDGVPSAFDNCPGIYNPTQQDCDGDGDGAECDQDGGDVRPPALCP